VVAQKLLFAHTESGDLTKLIDSYFDTGVGKKTDPASYQEVASSLSLEPNQIQFISDVVKELDAADDAGMQTCLCIRPGNPPQPATSRHRTIQSFDELFVTSHLNS